MALLTGIRNIHIINEIKTHYKQKYGINKE